MCIKSEPELSFCTASIIFNLSSVQSRNSCSINYLRFTTTAFNWTYCISTFTNNILGILFLKNLLIIFADIIFEIRCTTTYNSTLQCFCWKLWKVDYPLGNTHPIFWKNVFPNWSSLFHCKEDYTTRCFFF